MRTTSRFTFVSVAALAALVATTASCSAAPVPRDGAMSAHLAATDAVPVPVTPVTPPAPVPLSRVIVPGDTVWNLSLGWKVTMAQIAGYNRLADPNLILVGEVLKVPPAGYVPPPMAVPSPVAPARAAPTYTPPAPSYTAPSYTAPAVVSSGSGGCYGITDSNALYIIGKESGCSTAAVNSSSGACGIGQLMTGDACGGSGAAQASAMTSYVMGRYGSWAAAAAHERDYGWY